MKFGKIQDTSPVALGALLNSGAVQVCVLPLSVRVVTHMTSRIKLLFTRLVARTTYFCVTHGLRIASKYSELRVPFEKFLVQLSQGYLRNVFARNSRSE